MHSALEHSHTQFVDVWGDTLTFVEPIVDLLATEPELGQAAAQLVLLLRETSNAFETLLALMNPNRLITEEEPQDAYQNGEPD